MNDKMAVLHLDCSCEASLDLTYDPAGPTAAIDTYINRWLTAHEWCRRREVVEGRLIDPADDKPESDEGAKV